MLLKSGHLFWFPEHERDFFTAATKDTQKDGFKYSAWTFLQDSFALLAVYKETAKDDPNISDILVPQAAALVKNFKPFIVVTDDGTFTEAKHDWPFFWTTFKAPWRGAFLNCVTAYGLLLLYEMTEINAYLEIAENLLHTAAFNKKSAFLTRDEAGFLWCHEYCTRPINSDVNWLKRSGFSFRKDKCIRPRIYNGHIHCLLAFIKLRHLTKTAIYNDVINDCIATMAQYLPQQHESYLHFSYMQDFLMFPDYGAKRAVLLTEGLAAMTQDSHLSKVAQDMRAKLARNEGDWNRIYQESYETSKDMIEYEKSKAREESRTA
ncbi:MAG: hypothetical protein ACSHXY_00060 [Alphaproteobacteria bacterium]